MCAFFHSLGNDSVSRQFLKNRYNGFDIDEAHRFIVPYPIIQHDLELYLGLMI